MKMKHPEKELLPGLNRVKANLYVSLLVQYHLRIPEVFMSISRSADHVFKRKQSDCSTFLCMFVESIVSLQT